jgi:hypothetical protein
MLWALAQVCLISALELLKPWPLKLIIDSVLAGTPLPWGLGHDLGTGALLLGACVEQGTLAELVERRGAFAAMYGGPEARRQEDPLAFP